VRQWKTPLTPQKRPSLLAFNSLVVMAVDSMLRGQTGRKLESSDFMTRHLSGRSARVLAFGLAFMFSASRMTARERVAGKRGFGQI
jgi:hypothetical protein